MLSHLGISAIHVGSYVSVQEVISGCYRIGK